MEALPGPVGRKADRQTNEASFSPLHLRNTDLCLLSAPTLPREPPAPLLQGPGGPFGRPRASGPASLSAPVMGQAPAFK